MRHTLPLSLTAALLLAVGTGCASTSTQAPAARTGTALAASGTAAPLPTLPMTHTAADRAVRVLPNRMVLVAQRVPTAPVVSAQVWIKTGSLYEQEFVGAGLSHFLEHLLSGGSTRTRAEAESNAILGRIGAQTNAATSLDTVRYYINSTAGNREEAVALLSDWLQNNLIGEAEFEREREVIQREFSMGQGDPNRIFWKLTQKARFHQTPDHPGAHPTIGYLDDFLAIDRAQITDFYRRMYVPNNMVAVVSGDIDPQATLDQLTELWGDLPTGELPKLQFPIEPDTLEPITVTGHAGIAQPRHRLLWKGVELGSEHDYALDLLAVILGQGESSRLTQDLREDLQWVTSIDAFNYSATWGAGFFGVDFQPAPTPDRGEGQAFKDADLITTAVRAHLRALADQPVTDAELARAKRRVLSSVLKSGQTAEAVASRVAGDIISKADPDYMSRYAQAIQDVTAEDIRIAAAAVLPPEGHSTIVLLPADDDNPVTAMDRDADPPATADAATRDFDLDNARLIPDLAANLDDPAGRERSYGTDDTVTRTLDNGLTVILRPTATVPAVSMQLYTLGGLLADDADRAGVTNAAYAMLDRGADGRSARDLAAELESLGATLGAGSGNNTAYVTATALSDDLDAVLDIFSDVVLRPDFDDAEWQRLKPRLLAAIDRRNDRWVGELRSSFKPRYFGDHPWAHEPLGTRDTVAALTAEDLRAAYDQRLAAGRSALAVVGDFDAEALLPKLEAAFADMPAGEGTFAPPSASAPPTGTEIVATEKPVTAVQIGFGPGIARDHPDYPAMRVLSRLISDFPAGWLQQALRGEGPGLVYAAQGQNITGIIPGYFAILFNTSADTADEALRRALAVVERAKNEPVADDQLQRAKAKTLTEEFLGKQSNASLAAEAALNHLYNAEATSGDAFLAQVEALTADDIRRVAQTYLNDPFTLILTDQPDAIRAEAATVSAAE